MIRLASRLLRGVHAGEGKLLWHTSAIANAPGRLELRSTAFEDGAPIPQRFAGKGIGENLAPPLSWRYAPAETVEFALVVEDADAPFPIAVVHAIVTGIPPGTIALGEGFSGAGDLSFGRNTLGGRGYNGPRPLPGHGPHAYAFQLLALDRATEFASPPNRADLLRAVEGSVIARGRLDGIYEVP